MKKVLSFILVLCMMVSLLAACGGETKETEANTVAGTEGETEKQTEKETEDETEGETEADSEVESDTEADSEVESETEGEEDLLEAMFYHPFELEDYEIVSSVPDADLVTAHKKVTVGANEVKFICSDADGSGGIYAIGADVYNRAVTDDYYLPFDGWKRLDGAENYIHFTDGVTGTYPLATWPESGVFCLIGYIKEVEGLYFLWLDNSYSFGDPDGGWANDELGRTFGSIDYDTLETVFSDPFTMYVCQCDSEIDIMTRDVQWVDYDEEELGCIYRISEKLYNALEKGTETATTYGKEWTKLTLKDVYFAFSIKRNENIEDEFNYELLTGAEIEDRLGSAFYVLEKDGEYYMWMQYADALLYDFASMTDRGFIFYPVGEKTLARAVWFYGIPGFTMGGYKPLTTIVGSWM
ncbi:MAG: hypothetical protein E7623_05265 [Ruminococcaceae bacterium]|nr:hypothetical protein [Oscillospiraceae bacterium]